MSELVNCLQTAVLMVPAPALLKGGYGMFGDPIAWVQGLLGIFATLGLLAAVAIKATAGPDEERHTTAHRMAAACITGLLFALLAPDIYNLMFGWTGK